MLEKNRIDESRMHELVAELDRIIPEEDASIVFRQYGSGPDESAIIGNRCGLLRAGLALLSAGICPISEKKEPRELTALKRITGQGSQYFFDYFEVQDLSADMESDAHDARLTKVIGAALLMMSVIIVGFAIYGAVRLFV